MTRVRPFLEMSQGPDGTITCVIDAHSLAADPAVFGIALSDAAHHGAKAWAQAVGCSESEVLERIWQGLDAERGMPTDAPRQIN